MRVLNTLLIAISTMLICHSANARNEMLGNSAHINAMHKTKKPSQTHGDNEMYRYFYNLSSTSDLQQAKSNGWVDDSNTGLNMLERGMNSEAKSVGIQAGRYYAEDYIGKILKDSAEYLDTIFDISIYLDTYKHYLIVPAIINEIDGRKTYLTNEKISFLYADKTYIIQQQPYFVDVPPSWKNYVVLNSQPPQIASQSLLPSTSEEKARWKVNFANGWKLGIDQSIDNVVYQLGRALHDLQGMQRYTMLRDAGLVSDPIIKEQHIPVSGNNKKMELNGGMISITTMPIMQHNPSNWKVIPKLPPLDEFLPRRFYSMLDRIR